MNTRDDLPPETVDQGATSLSARLIRHAASRMPPGLAERLAEEWSADLAEQRGALNRLRFALGCCWARQLIGREPHLYGARLNAAGHGSVEVINPPYPSLVPSRSAAFLIIVALHIAAALAFIYGIALHELPMTQSPMNLTFFSEPKPATPPPPVPRPQFKHDAVRIPEPPPLSPLPSAAADALQSTAQPAPPLPAPTPAAVRVSGGIGKGFPSTADFYPPAAIRLSEAGLTGVSVCVDDRGRLTNEPKIAVTSGSPRLDGGALALARAASGHYRSTTENGKAISGCFQIGVRFALKS